MMFLAGNLKYGVNFDIREEPVNFEKYKDYAFKAPSSEHSKYIIWASSLRQPTSYTLDLISLYFT